MKRDKIDVCRYCDSKELKYLGYKRYVWENQRGDTVEMIADTYKCLKCGELSIAYFGKRTRVRKL